MNYQGRKKHLVLLAGITACCVISLRANAEPIELNISPIIGYEQVQQVLPTPHTVTRLYYGALVTAGIMLISAEAQYTRSNNQETLDTLSQTSVADKLKVGLRSGFRVGPILSFFARGGLEASQEKIDQTQNGTTSTTYRGPFYRPYAGLGARGNLSRKFAATVDVVAVIPNINDLSQNEYQVTAGFAIRLP